MAHNIIQYGINSSGDVVEGSGYIEEALVDGVVVGGRGAVDEEQALEVERCPAYEERDHHRRWKQNTVVDLE